MTSADDRSGPHRRHPRGRVLRAHGGGPHGVPAAVPHHGRRPVLVLPGLGLPVLRRPGRPRGPLGRRAHVAGVDPGRPARGELRHVHGRRRRPRVRRQRLRRGLPRALHVGPHALRRVSVAVMGWTKALSDEDITRLLETYLRSLPRPGRVLRPRGPRPRVVAAARHGPRRGREGAEEGAAGHAGLAAGRADGRRGLLAPVPGVLDDARARGRRARGGRGRLPGLPRHRAGVQADGQPHVRAQGRRRQHGLRDRQRRAARVPAARRGPHPGAGERRRPHHEAGQRARGRAGVPRRARRGVVRAPGPADRGQPARPAGPRRPLAGLGADGGRARTTGSGSSSASCRRTRPTWTGRR